MNEDIGTSAIKRHYPPRNIQETIEWRSEGAGEFNWKCKDCIHHQGGVSCAMNVFIAFVCANMSNCIYYQKGFKCVHCGKYSVGEIK